MVNEQMIEDIKYTNAKKESFRIIVVRIPIDEWEIILNSEPKKTSYPFIFFYLYLTAGIEQIAPFKNPSFSSLENALKIFNKFVAIVNITSIFESFNKNKNPFHRIDKYFLSLLSSDNFAS